MRTSSLRALIRPVTLSMAWVPVAASAALALGLLIATTSSRPPGLPQTIEGVRRAGVFLVLGAPFFLDDPAAVTIASMPITLLQRRGLRLLITVAALAAAWALILGYASVRMNGGGLPIGALTLETAAWFMFGSVIAAVSLARGSAGGPSGGVAVFLVSWAVPWLPDRWSLLGGSPGSGDWAASHERWAIVLGVSLALTIWLSLDPARRIIRARLGRARTVQE